MINKRNLIISIMLGVLASLAGYYYLLRLEAQVTGAEVYDEVLITTQNIDENTKITEDMLQMVRRPVNTIIGGAVTNPRDAIGKISITNLVKGEQVTEGRLESEVLRGSFSSQVEKGFRAVTVQVNDDSTISGLLEPGDVIDIIGTFDDYLQNSRSVNTFIENVTVLAVGDKFSRYSQDSEVGTDESLLSWSVQPNTVTLSLRPDDAETVVLLERYGHMKFVLRAEGDFYQEMEQMDNVKDEEECDLTIRIIRGTDMEEVHVQR